MGRLLLPSFSATKRNARINRYRRPMWTKTSGTIRESSPSSCQESFSRFIIMIFPSGKIEKRIKYKTLKISRYLSPGSLKKKISSYTIHHQTSIALQKQKETTATKSRRADTEHREGFRKVRISEIPSNPLWRWWDTNTIVPIPITREVSSPLPGFPFPHPRSLCSQACGAAAGGEVAAPW